MLMNSKNDLHNGYRPTTQSIDYLEMVYHVCMIFIPMNLGNRTLNYYCGNVIVLVNYVLAQVCENISPDP